VGATLLVEGDGFELASRSQGVGGQSLAVRGLHATYDDLFLPLFGEHAARNAAAAVAAVEALLGRALNEGALRRVLAAATSPGRLEVVGRHPLVVLDGAHNLDAAEALASTLRESFRWNTLHVVLAMFDDKDVEGFARIVAPLADRAYASRSSSPRAAPLQRVAVGLSSAGMERVETFDNVREAVDAARAAAGQDDLILVTGSLYTVADARPLLKEDARG
jgi:dihydrofolate synthase/folylpolyglutamate synthase